MAPSSWISPHCTSHCCTSANSEPLPLPPMGLPRAAVSTEAAAAEARCCLDSRWVAMWERTGSLSREWRLHTRSTQCWYRSRKPKRHS